MFKKIILALTLICGFAATSNAQLSFQHSAGGAVYLSKDFSSYGIVYSPRLNFYQPSDEMTLSLGAQLGVNMDGNFNSQTGVSGSFGYDLPVYLGMNFGAGASKDSKALVGGFLGGGYSVSSFSYANDFGAWSDSFSGPMAIAGIRANIKEQVFELNGSYTLNGGDKTNILGLRLLYQF